MRTRSALWGLCFTVFLIKFRSGRQVTYRPISFNVFYYWVSYRKSLCWAFFPSMTYFFGRLNILNDKDLEVLNYSQSELLSDNFNINPIKVIAVSVVHSACVISQQNFITICKLTKTKPLNIKAIAHSPKSYSCCRRTSTCLNFALNPAL